MLKEGLCGAPMAAAMSGETETTETEKTDVLRHDEVIVMMKKIQEQLSSLLEAGADFVGVCFRCLSHSFLLYENGSWIDFALN